MDFVAADAAAVYPRFRPEADGLTDREFHALAVAQLDAVYRLACHLARNNVEAEDLVQETFLRAFRSADTFTLGAHGIRPWLFKILHNVLLTRGQQKQREKAVLAEIGNSQPIIAPEFSRDCASMDWDNVDERVKAAIGSLSVEYRLVFMLWALEGLKYREIAEIADVPIGTVMSRLARARTQLSERLTEYRGELGLHREQQENDPSSERVS